MDTHVITCTHCSSIFKNEINLKIHMKGSKKCLKLRGLKITSEYTCDACESVFMNKVNLSVHHESCKDYIVLKYRKEIETLKEKHAVLLDKYEQINGDYEEQQKIISDLEISNKKNIKLLHNLEKTVNELTNKLENTTVDRDEYISMKVRYEDHEKNHQQTLEKLEKERERMMMSIEKERERIMTTFGSKIEQCDSFIQTLAKDGSNKVTTTTTNVVNNIRNQLSTTYTLDKLEQEQIETILRQYYTQRDFYGGQKQLAEVCVERILKTPDNKFMLCCTDSSRKKFRIFDMNGNMKEDIEARMLCEKLKIPINIITKEIYEKIVEKIDKEQSQLASDDYSKKDKLFRDRTLAYDFYIENQNFHESKYNQEFIHELCVLLNI